MRSLIVAALLALASPSALACMAKLKPKAESLDDYTLVFVGEVVGVRLSTYIVEGDVHRDTTPEYEVEALSIRVLKGNAAPIEKLRAGGCAVREPSPREKGLFAVDRSGKAFVIYERERGYTPLLIDMTSCAAGRCRHVEQP